MVEVKCLLTLGREREGELNKWERNKMSIGIAKWLKKSHKGLHSTVHYTLTIVFVSYLFGQGTVVTPSRMGHCCH